MGLRQLYRTMLLLRIESFVFHTMKHELILALHIIHSKHSTLLSGLAILLIPELLREFRIKRSRRVRLKERRLGAVSLLLLLLL